MRFLVLVLFIFSINSVFFAQNIYQINNIHFEGNNRTENFIILNELDFKIGDSLDITKIDILFSKNSARLKGTGLFIDAFFNLENIDTDSYKLDIKCKVVEAWYLYPYFIFELVDRNFNEWIYEHNASLHRINFGVDIQHKNLTGNKDILDLKLQVGLISKLELTYIRPYLHKNTRFGFNFNILKKSSTEIAYKTVNNKLERYFTEGRPLLEQFRVSTGIMFRSDINNNHILNIYYHYNSIDSIVLNTLNFNFLSESLKQKYFTISYNYSFDKRDFKIYPHKGYLILLELSKSGLGLLDHVNLLTLRTKFEKYFKFSDNIFSTYNLESKTSLIKKEIAYINNRALGYDETFLRGYELYVIDGEDFIMLKTSQKINLMQGQLDISKWMKINQFKSIPYEFYLSLNFDCGYVNNNTNFVLNNFTNRFLFGYGPSLDILIYHNLFQISYSLNHTGKGGIYFHYVNNI